MSENNLKRQAADDTHDLFGIPDTGVSISWKYGGETGETDKKGTYLRPITPKPTKYSSKIYRRRCLTQVKIPDDGDDAFVEEMLSLVNGNRKTQKESRKNSPGVSPKGRSPRNTRSKTSKPSPLRDDNFQFLLNDSIENDDMIRCSQITEAALKEEQMESPVVPVRANSKRLALSKNVGSPTSRKRLLDAITSSQKGSLLRQTTKLPSAASPAKVPADPDPVKSTDQCNNFRTSFGSRDDELFLNVLCDSSKVENELPKKSPRLSLNQRRLALGVTPLAHKKEEKANELAVPSIIISECSRTDPVRMEDDPVESAAICQDLDDDMDLFLELSPHLEALLDGHVDGAKNESASKVEVGSLKEKTESNAQQTSLSTNRLCVKADPALSSTKSITMPEKALGASLSLPKYPGAKQGTSLALIPKKSSAPSLIETAPRANEAVRPSNSLMRHASAPGSTCPTGPSRASQAAQTKPLPNARLAQNKGQVRRCTPEEIERKRQEALRKLKRSQTK